MPALSLPSTLYSIEIVGLAALALISAFLAYRIFQLERRLQTLLKAGDGSNLESSLRAISEEHERFKSFQDEARQYFSSIEKRIRRSVQSIETIRFNPFKGAGGGGNQSFATAFLNEHGDGVIVSSLYARDRMSIFTKPVNRFSPQHELSSEEQEVLNLAKQSLSQLP